MIIKLLTEHHLEFLSLKGGCRGWSESTLGKMSNCWKSPATAQFLFQVSFTLCLLGNFTCFFFSSADFFSKSTFSKNSFRNTIIVSNRLDPDQARHFVGSDLIPNCLQKLSADDTSR